MAKKHHWTCNRPVRFGGIGVKRLKTIAVMLILLATVSAIYLKYQATSEITTSDYEDWEMQCMKEYDSSKDYYVLVDITQHKLFLFKGDEMVKEYKVSTGKYDSPSPVGIFKVISKSDWGEGFGGTWMGFNVPWGKYGLHGTLNPGSIGWNSSQGCIRMYNKEVKELSKAISYGTKVEIYGGALGPFGSSLRTLTPGDRGSDVMEVQRRLKKLGYFYGSVDGIYGAGMDTAVIKFQRAHKLRADKVIGKRMYDLLGIIPFE